MLIWKLRCMPNVLLRMRSKLALVWRLVSACLSPESVNSQQSGVLNLLATFYALQSRLICMHLETVKSHATQSRYLLVCRAAGKFTPSGRVSLGLSTAVVRLRNSCLLLLVQVESLKKELNKEIELNAQLKTEGSQQKQVHAEAGIICARLLFGSFCWPSSMHCGSVCFSNAKLLLYSKHSLEMSSAFVWGLDGQVCCWGCCITCMWGSPHLQHCTGINVTHCKVHRARICDRQCSADIAAVGGRGRVGGSGRSLRAVRQAPPSAAQMTWATDSTTKHLANPLQMSRSCGEGCTFSAGNSVSKVSFTKPRFGLCA